MVPQGGMGGTHLSLLRPHSDGPTGRDGWSAVSTDTAYKTEARKFASFTDLGYAQIAKIVCLQEKAWHFILATKLPIKNHNCKK